MTQLSPEDMEAEIERLRRCLAADTERECELSDEALRLKRELATESTNQNALEAEIGRLRELVWVMHDWMARALHDKSCRRWEYDEIVRRMAEMGFEVGA